ncbi:MAG: hypothetical protein AB1425_00875 [Actinomycetota bacterium]
MSKNKSVVLAERYARAYGLEISAYPNYLAPSTPFRELVPEGSIVVGAVDNAATRRLLHERLSVYEDVVYVDAGNAAAQALSERPTHEELARVLETGWEGQVVCGVRKEHRTVLPFPADAFPDLVEGEDRLPTEAPCGEAVVSQPQRHLTNVMAATVVLSYLTPLLTDGTVLHHKSFFDARRGYLRSEAAIQLLDQVRV